MNINEKYFEIFIHKAKEIEAAIYFFRNDVINRKIQHDFFEKLTFFWKKNSMFTSVYPYLCTCLDDWSRFNEVHFFCIDLMFVILLSPSSCFFFDVVFILSYTYISNILDLAMTCYDTTYTIYALELIPMYLKIYNCWHLINAKVCYE